MDRLLFSFAAVLACGSVPAHAADASADAAADSAVDAAADQPIVVTGQQVKYGSKSTSTATKTDTDVKDIPQALTTVTAQQIEDQQLRSVGDLMLFVPGASYNAGRATATRSCCAATAAPPTSSSTSTIETAPKVSALHNLKTTPNPGITSPGRRADERTQPVGAELNDVISFGNASVCQKENDSLPYCNTGYWNYWQLLSSTTSA